MCPGGIIAPCATSQNEVVTNGWSPSKRDYPSSNSGIVVELKIDDFKEFSNMGVFSGLEFQKSIEKKAWEMAGKTQKVPAQRLVDFVNGKLIIVRSSSSYNYFENVYSTCICTNYVSKKYGFTFRKFRKCLFCV